MGFVILLWLPVGAVGERKSNADTSMPFREGVSKVLDALGSLPTVVDTERRRWTVALALAARRVPGDFVETGVYKGGMSIAMMKVLDRTPGLEARRHWACDSFLGVPPPSAQDSLVGLQSRGRLCKQEKCSRSKVAHSGRWMSTHVTFLSNVRRYNVSEGRLRVVAGWFKDHAAARGARSNLLPSARRRPV